MEPYWRGEGPDKEPKKTRRDVDIVVRIADVSALPGFAKRCDSCDVISPRLIDIIAGESESARYCEACAERIRIGLEATLHGGI